MCGIPLFIVPRGRTFEDFKNETTHHGWPSFHDEEIVKGNVVNETGGPGVRSACGTHLGDNLPEGGHNRYCLDLACVSGHPKKAAPLVCKDAQGRVDEPCPASADSCCPSRVPGRGQACFSAKIEECCSSGPGAGYVCPTGKCSTRVGFDCD